MKQPPPEQPLSALNGRRVALPESRRLDVLAAMLEKRGARLLRCPLVAILDAPDPEPVLDWIERFADRPPDVLILLTGEGLRRLLGFAERAGRREAFVGALARTHTLTRGPKPGQALKEIGLKPGTVAEAPTTDGVIATLEKMELRDKRAGVQLYGENPNEKLVEYLRGRGASVDTVAPYVYAPDSDEEQVRGLIEELAAGRVDAIAFTSQPQLKRLQSVARKAGLETELQEGLERTVVAAIGPVMAGALEEVGVRVDMMPDASYFMKPMVSGLETLFAKEPPKTPKTPGRTGKTESK